MHGLDPAFWEKDSVHNVILRIFPYTLFYYIQIKYSLESILCKERQSLNFKYHIKLIINKLFKLR